MFAQIQGLNFLFNVFLFSAGAVYQVPLREATCSCRCCETALSAVSAAEAERPPGCRGHADGGRGSLLRATPQGPGIVPDSPQHCGWVPRHPTGSSILAARTG